MTIDKLMEKQKYLVGVMAYTRVGDGPMSELVSVFTTPGGGWVVVMLDGC